MSLAVISPFLITRGTNRTNDDEASSTRGTRGRGNGTMTISRESDVTHTHRNLGLYRVPPSRVTTRSCPKPPDHPSVGTRHKVNKYHRRYSHRPCFTPRRPSRFTTPVPLQTVNPDPPPTDRSYPSTRTSNASLSAFADLAAVVALVGPPCPCPFPGSSRASSSRSSKSNSRNSEGTATTPLRKCVFAAARSLVPAFNRLVNISS